MTEYIKNKKDFILGVATIVIAALITILSMQLRASGYDGDPGPKMFPMTGAAIMLICGIALIIKPGKVAGTFLTRKQWLSALTMFGVYIGVALLFFLLGFMLSLPIIAFTLTFLMSRLSLKELELKKRILKSLIYAVIASVCVYLAYVVGLNARLPEGLVFKLLY